MNRTALLLACLPVLATPAVAQVETRAERVSASAWRDPRAENLERALAAIDKERVRADIYFIASDELEGRDSPSRGLRIAARYIRARLERLGLQPGAPEGSYFYEYQLAEYVMEQAGCFASLEVAGQKRPLVFGQDYFLPGTSHSRDALGPIVFGGSFDEAEIEGKDFSGKWVLLRPGTRLSRRASAGAADKGLHGFIVPADPRAEGSVAEAFARYSSRLEQPSMRRPRGGIVTVFLSEGVSTALTPAELPAVGAPIGGSFHEAWSTVERPLILENVCGLWPGSDPKLRDEVIIISAHYDHVGSRSNGDIYNGADDNGSGTTGLMAIAEALKAYGPMRRTVLLMWVSAEEKGLLGSRAWTLDPWLPEGMQAICDLNIDMIGRNAPTEIGVTPTKDRPEYNRLTQLVEKHMGAEGFTTLNSADAYWGRSDHANFSRNLKIPVAFLFSDVHEDYHQPTDTPDKIDCDKLTRVARLVVRMLHDLQADELDFNSD